jgi:hypothetical protein
LSQYLDISHEYIEEIEDDEDIRQIEDIDTSEERINIEKQDIEDEPTTTKSS